MLLYIAFYLLVKHHACELAYSHVLHIYIYRHMGMCSKRNVNQLNVEAVMKFLHIKQSN